jgi:hypothetical protein
MYPYTSRRAVEVDEALSRRPGDVLVVRPVERHYSMWRLTNRRVDELVRLGYESLTGEGLATVRAWAAQTA